MMIRIFLLLLVPMVSFGFDRLSALSMIESGNNDRAVGKVGEISRYQIRKGEWRSVTRSTRYSDPQLAKTVALVLIERRVQQFRASHHRDPSDFEFYVLWNAPAQALRGKVSPVVAERARRFSNLCSLSRKPPAVAAQTHAPEVLPGMLLAQVN